MTTDTAPDDPLSCTIDLAEDLRRSIGRFVRSIRNKTEAEKSAQSEALGLLDREGAMNVAMLANRRGVTHQTMRVMVGQMVASGLIERRPDPKDGRSHLLTLSVQGRRVLAAARLARAAHIAAIVEKVLSVTERNQLEKAITLIDRVSAAAEGGSD